MRRRVLSIAVASFALLAACDSTGNPVAGPNAVDGAITSSVAMSATTSSVVAVNAQHAAIQDLVSAFHGALNAQDYDAILSLWAADATATAFGNTYVGAVAIADFFETSGPFVNGWAALAPSYKTRISIHGDRATFAFECVYVADTGNLAGQTVVAHLNATGSARKVGQRWMFEEFVGGIGPLP